MNSSEAMLTAYREQNLHMRSLLQSGVFIVDEILALQRVQADLAERWTSEVAKLPRTPSVTDLPTKERSEDGWHRTPKGVLVLFRDGHPVEIQDPGFPVAEVVTELLGLGWDVELGEFDRAGTAPVIRARRREHAFDPDPGAHPASEHGDEPDDDA
jgi:hypothetical protein